MEAMKTVGTIISEARRAAGMSQKDLAAKMKKEDGQPISAQYLNDNRARPAQPSLRVSDRSNRKPARP
jgi:ribosome-binding protein aMBF1 (putative translation factor)